VTAVLSLIVLAEITVSDMTRLPQPPGRDEIAQPARTTNRTLARLEEAVNQAAPVRVRRLP
jgi:hypothetical protein